jgi:hypothetical protein
MDHGQRHPEFSRAVEHRVNVINHGPAVGRGLRQISRKNVDGNRQADVRSDLLQICGRTVSPVAMQQFDPTNAQRPGKLDDILTAERAGFRLGMDIPLI